MATLALSSRARGVFFTIDGHYSFLQTHAAKSDSHVMDLPGDREGRATESQTAANLTTPSRELDVVSASEPDAQATEPSTTNSANITTPFRAADALSIKTRANSNLCMDASLGNYQTEIELAQIYMHPCNGEGQEKFYFDGMTLKNKYYSKLCLDESRFQFRADDNKTGYMNDCNGRVNQKWYFEGETLRTLWNYTSSELCLTFHPSNHLLDFEECAPKDVNQQFYFEHVPLKAH